MDNATITRLNTINRDFYATVAADFDATRGRAWPGWLDALPHIRAIAPAEPPLTALDVGCGNGRFGAFLAEGLGRSALHYHGCDNNTALLDAARATLDLVRSQRTAPFAFTLETRDIVTHPPADGAYHLVGLFGVLHHIPGAANRRDFMRALAARVRPGGRLIVAAWCFHEFERFRERVVPWPDDLRARVEPGDYLLDWRRGAEAVRYCHYVDEAEHAALVAATGLQHITTYRADGHTGTVNRYSVLARP